MRDIADMGADPFGSLPKRQRHSPLLYLVLISSVCLVRPSSAGGTRTWHWLRRKSCKITSIYMTPICMDGLSEDYKVTVV